MCWILDRARGLSWGNGGGGGRLCLPIVTEAYFNILATGLVSPENCLKYLAIVAKDKAKLKQ